MIGAYSVKPLRTKKNFYFSTKTYDVGSQKNCLNEGSFEHPKQMLKLIGKKIFTILHTKILFT